MTQMPKRVAIGERGPGLMGERKWMRKEEPDKKIVKQASDGGGSVESSKKRMVADV